MGEGFEGGMETSTDSAPALEAGAETMESIETPSVESFDMPEDSGGFEGVDNEESGILDQIGDNSFEEYNTDDIEMNDSVDEYTSIEDQLEVSEDGDTGIDDLESEMDADSFSGEGEYPSFEDQLSDEWSEDEWSEGDGLVDETSSEDEELVHDPEVPEEGIESENDITPEEVEISPEEVEFDDVPEVPEEGIESEDDLEPEEVEITPEEVEISPEEVEFDDVPEVPKEGIESENDLAPEEVDITPEEVEISPEEVEFDDVPEVPKEGIESEDDLAPEEVDITPEEVEISPEEVEFDDVPEVPEEGIESENDLAPEEVEITPEEVEFDDVPEVPEEGIESEDDLAPEEVDITPEEVEISPEEVEFDDVSEVSEEGIESENEFESEEETDLENELANEEDVEIKNETSDAVNEDADTLEESKEEFDEGDEDGKEKIESDEETSDEIEEDADKLKENEEDSDEGDEDGKEKTESDEETSDEIEEDADKLKEDEEDSDDEDEDGKEKTESDEETSDEIEEDADKLKEDEEDSDEGEEDGKEKTESDEETSDEIEEDADKLKEDEEDSDDEDEDGKEKTESDEETSDEIEEDADKLKEDEEDSDDEDEDGKEKTESDEETSDEIEEDADKLKEDEEDSDDEDEDGKEKTESDEETSDEIEEDADKLKEDEEDSDEGEEDGKEKTESDEETSDEIEEDADKLKEDEEDSDDEDEDGKEKTESDEETSDEIEEDADKLKEDEEDSDDEDEDGKEKTESDEETSDEIEEDADKLKENEEDSDDEDEDGERVKKADNIDEDNNRVDGNEYPESENEKDSETYESDEDKEEYENDRNAEGTNDSDYSSDGENHLNKTENEIEEIAEDDNKENREDFLKDENYDAILNDAMTENNSDTTTLENLNNTVYNLDEAIESNDLKIENLQEKISETDNPEEKANLENQLLSAQEYKSMLEETRETAEQRRKEALNISEDKLSEMQEKSDNIRKLASANNNEIREGNCKDEEFEKISSDTAAALGTAKAEQDLINQACENKYQEIYDYVTANNMDRYDCQYDPEYRKMVGQYREMLSVKDHINETVSSLENTNEMIRIESDGRVQPQSLDIKSPEVNLDVTAGGKNVEAAVKQADEFQKKIDNGEIASQETADIVISDLTSADIQISQQIEAKREQMSALNLSKDEAGGDIRFQKLSSEVEALKKQKESIRETASCLEKTAVTDGIKPMDDRIKEAYTNGYYNPLDGRTIMGGVPTELSGLSKDQVNAEYEKALRGNPNDETGKYDFITNDGEKITFKEGIDRITSKAGGYMDEMGVPKDKQKDVIAEIEETIKRQQYCTIQRSLGDHGIKHIYGNFERSDSFLKGMDPETKLAALIAEVHHDEGYTDSSIHCPGNFKAGTHGMLSAAYFNQNHRPVYEGVFTDPSKLNSVVKAMATHNDSFDSKLGIVKGASLSRAEMERNLNVENDVIVSAIHLADKMALSEREKIPLVMDDPKMKQIMQASLLSYELVKESELTGDELIEHKSRVNAELREGIEQYLAKKDIPEMYKMNYFKAIEDINTESGKFNIPMNMIGMSSESLKMEVVDGKLAASMHIDILDENSAKTIIGDGYDRQVRKLFEDLHFPENKAKQIVGDVLSNKEKDVTVDIGNGNCVVFHKKEIIPEDINESREQYKKTGQEIEKSNLSLYSKHCNEIKEALEKDDLESWTKVMNESFSTVRMLRETKNLEQARELLEVLQKSHLEVMDFKNRTANVSMKGVIERQKQRTMETIAGYYREYYKKNVDVYKKYHYDILQRLFDNQERE